ncbi:MAG TPA: hypothetical protein VHI78_00755 [Bacteroidales bacterium]|jgi:hypothetical protein|nr:hypothetical protein [Bacteroidales bacterium]
MKNRSMLRFWPIGFVVFSLIMVQCSSKEKVRSEPDESGDVDSWNSSIDQNAKDMIEKGKAVFRFETFGDEAFWTDKLQLHKAIADSKHGGLGEGLTPEAALAAGLKVDLTILPEVLKKKIQDGKFLNDPLVTLELLKLNAVVGVIGKFDGNGNLSSIGVTCASCHSTVNSPTGIGRRLDGWANRDLNVGAIIAMSPDLSAVEELLGVDSATVKKVLASWGPGKYDAELNIDGKAFRPDGKSAATLIPEAFGQAGHNLHAWTGGWGNVTYWNAYVANLQLQGQGNFYDPRLMDAKQYPVAAKAGFGNKRSKTEDDKITDKLAALDFYQLAMPAPKAPDSIYNKEAADRGQLLFDGKAKCSSCHVPPTFAEPGWNAHKPEDICIDDFQSNRSPDKTYVTQGLKGLWTHMKGGFYHDGRFATLKDVVNHYDACKNLELSENEKNDLIEYLKSL